MVTGTEQVKDQLNEGTAALEDAINNTQETLIQMDDQGLSFFMNDVVPPVNCNSTYVGLPAHRHLKRAQLWRGGHLCPAYPLSMWCRVKIYLNNHRMLY